MSSNIVQQNSTSLTSSTWNSIHNTYSSQLGVIQKVLSISLKSIALIFAFFADFIYVPCIYVSNRTVSHSIHPTLLHPSAPPNPHLLAAGVLPVWYNRQTREWEALLGEEHNHYAGKSLFSTFSGKADGDSALRAAAREAAEETCFMLGNPSKVITPQFILNKIGEIEKRLSEQKSPALVHKNRQGKEVYTYLYVVSDEERARITNKNFKLQQRKVCSVNPGYLDPQMEKILAGALEKTKIAWVRLNPLLQTVSVKRKEYMVYDVNGSRIGELHMPTVLSLRTASTKSQYSEPMHRFLSSAAQRIQRESKGAA